MESEEGLKRFRRKFGSVFHMRFSERIILRADDDDLLT